MLRRAWACCCLALLCSVMTFTARADPILEAPRVLVIIAHPDDETMFNLGRFQERGWNVTVALVTNGENGSIVQRINPDYETGRDGDVLIESAPGPGVWTRRPPAGRRLKAIATPQSLAMERRREFLESQAVHGVSLVFFLSSVPGADFEDSWDHGIRNWDLALLLQRLKTATRRSRPNLIITLNPDETWAHPQHVGLARCVRDWLHRGEFDSPGQPRPTLYGLREHGWYHRSAEPQTGDVQFDRLAWSPALQMTYAEHWRRASSRYVSQSSHPNWFEARAGVGLLPGYHDVDIIRQLDAHQDLLELGALFARFPPDRDKARRLPLRPRIEQLN